MVLSATALRCKRARSWQRWARQFSESDLDARFIFLWIALNALYGRAKYRDANSKRTPEFKDIKEFLNAMLRVDSGAIKRTRRESDIRQRTALLLGDKFLNDKYWMKWDEEEIVEKDAREPARVRVIGDMSDLLTLFNRLYTLRKQIFSWMFHGSREQKSILSSRRSAGT